MKMKVYSFLSIFSVMLLLLTGCGKQSYVSVSDSRGIQEGAPVIWYEGDAFVGKVSKVKAVDDHFQIFIEFQKNFEKSIRFGVRACPLQDPKISNQPILLLVGGKDASMPILEPGSQIPEISLSELQRMKQLNFWEWFSGAKMGLTIALAALIVILFIICLLKIVAKLVKIAIYLAIIGIVVFYILNLTGDWENYKEEASKYVKEIKVEEIQDWLQKNYSNLKGKIPGVMQNINILEEIRDGMTAPATTEQPQSAVPSQNTDNSQGTDLPQNTEQQK